MACVSNAEICKLLKQLACMWSTCPDCDVSTLPTILPSCFMSATLIVHSTLMDIHPVCQFKSELFDRVGERNNLRLCFNTYLTYISFPLTMTVYVRCSLPVLLGMVFWEHWSVIVQLFIALHFTYNYVTGDVMPRFGHILYGVLICISNILCMLAWCPNLNILCMNV